MNILITIIIFLDYFFSNSRVEYQAGINTLTMVIKNLQEMDSGEYKCSASSNNNEELNLYENVRVKIKQSKWHTYIYKFKTEDLSIEGFPR